MEDDDEGPLHTSVRVSKQAILACLKCPLCKKLLEDVTTISECLHSFCRECIHARLNEGDSDCCPVCDVYLGCIPMEKLRADPQLDELRLKLFPDINNKKRKAQRSYSPPPPMPVKRKERTLSSLGVLSIPSSSTPTAGTPTATAAAAATTTTATTTAATAATTRRSRGRSTKHVSDSSEEKDVKPRRRSRRTATAIATAATAAAEAAAAAGASKEGAVSIGNREEKGKAVEFNSPLDFLAELADTNVDDEDEDEDDDHHQDHKLGSTSNGGGEMNRASTSGAAPESAAAKVKTSSSLRKLSRDKSATFTNGEGGKVVYHRTDRHVKDKIEVMEDKKSVEDEGVWFALKASDNQGEECALPQIPTPYLRIKDGKLPVSIVKKYLVKKLQLKSEAEVEITCQGQPIVPSLALERVRNIWLTAAPSPSSPQSSLPSPTPPSPSPSPSPSPPSPSSSAVITTSVVMVLTYGRRH